MASTLQENRTRRYRARWKGTSSVASPINSNNQGTKKRIFIVDAVALGYG